MTVQSSQEVAADMSSSSDETWQPLSSPDHCLLIVAATHQALVVVAVTHLLWCRRWPPYVVKNVPLVCVTGIAGVINLVGVVISFGFLEFSEPSVLSNCFFHGVVTWTGAGLYYCSAVVRVYRNYKVLIRRSADMLRPVVQILLLQLPIWVVSFSLLFPSVTHMDFDVNRCEGQARFVLLGAFNYAGILLLVAVFLLWKMRNVRKQMNEYRVMMLSLGFLLFTVILLNASAGVAAANNTVARRIALVNNIVRSALLFWPVIFTPLLRFVMRDVGYAEQFAVGLEPTLTPAMLRASFADQLKVDELWVPFQKIADRMISPTLLDFYKACMDRDKEEGYFERQALTMDVIDTFVAEIAPRRVDLSSGVRERILASEVTRYNIFREATAEVLAIMQETCEETFQGSEAYVQLLRKADRDEAEMEALKKAKLIPEATSVNGRTRAGGESNSSISERWTISTVTARKITPIDDETRVWFCCPWWRLNESAASPDRQKSGRTCVSTVTALDTMTRSNTLASVPSVPAPQRGIVGNKSDVASLGLNSPADAVGWGSGSPLPWLAEEDIEMGNASSGEEGNTRTPSNLSVANKDGNRFFDTARTPRLPPAEPPAASPSSPMSSPSPGTPRAKLPAPPAKKRPLPVPWAPWRRLPEPPITPFLSSPPRDSRAGRSHGVEAKEEAEAVEVGDANLGDGEEEQEEEMSSGSSDSIVVLMPPSPATPPSPCSSCSRAGEDSGRRLVVRSEGLDVVEEGRGGCRCRERARRGGSGGVGGAAAAAACAARGAAALERFSPCAGAVVSSRWGSTRLVAEGGGGFGSVGNADEREERQRSSAQGETVCSLCTAVPITGLLAAALAKEEEEETKAEEKAAKNRALLSAGRVEVVAAGSTAAAAAEEEDEMMEGAGASQGASADNVERMERGETGYWSPGSNVFAGRVVEVEGGTNSGAGDEGAPRSPAALETSSVASLSVLPSLWPGSQQQQPPWSQSPPPVLQAMTTTAADDRVAARPSWPLPPPELPLSVSSSASSSPVSLSISPSSQPPSPPGARQLVPLALPLVEPPRLSLSSSSSATPSPQALSSSSLKPSSLTPSSLTPSLPATAVLSSSLLNQQREPLAAVGSEAAADHSDTLRVSGLTQSSPAMTPSILPAMENGTASVVNSAAAVRSAPAPEPDRPPQPTTPPPAVLEPRRGSSAREKGEKGRGRGRVERVERAPRSRVVVAAAQAQARLVWASQPPAGLVASHKPGGKASQPGRAQPARAPAWGETPPLPLPQDFPSTQAPASVAVPHVSSSAFAPPPLPSTPPTLTPPLPTPLLPLTVDGLGGPPSEVFTPPSPAGRSTSASPVSVRSSPVLPRPPLQALQAASLPPAVPASGRDLEPSRPGIPLLWSWSDSTLSGSRSEGFGGGASSVSASVCSDYASPLVGMRFIGGGSEGESDGGSMRDGVRSRPNSSVAGAAGVPVIVPAVVGIRGSPPLRRVGEDRGGWPEAATGEPAKVGEAVGVAAGAAVGVAVGAAAAKPSLEGGVGGRQGKRPRRFFFP